MYSGEPQQEFFGDEKDYVSFEPGIFSPKKSNPNQSTLHNPSGPGPCIRNRFILRLGIDKQGIYYLSMQFSEKGMVQMRRSFGRKANGIMDLHRRFRRRSINLVFPFNQFQYAV
jgi:hypothetical protein